MWIFWALSSALFAASRRPLEKKLVNQLHHFTYGFIVQLLSLPIITVALLLNGKFLNPLHLGVSFWLPLLIVGLVFYPLNSFLYLQAVKRGDLSKVLPIQSLWPVFALIAAWLTLGEIPTIVASTGVMFTVVGVYALGLKGRRLHHPLQPFREDKSSLYMLLGVILVTCISLLEKGAVKASSALFYSFASTVCAIFAFFAAMYVTKGSRLSDTKPALKHLGIVGSLHGATYSSYLIAISVGPIAYVSALRGSNVLMGALIGIVLLKEKLTKAKIVSFVFIAVGAVLLATGSSA